MLRIDWKLTVRKGPLRNLQYLWSPPPGILSGILLRNNTTILEATMISNIQYGPDCNRKGTRQYHISKISPIP